MARGAWRVALFACLMLAVCGCGEQTVTIKGQLLLDGKALDLGALPKAGKDVPAFPPAVIFLPAAEPADGKGKRYRATLDINAGTYEVQLPPGKYRVSVFVPGLSAETPAPADTPNASSKVYELNASQSLNLPVQRP
ncbi:MAG: hypothetical protein L0Z62_07110 [Gemmataceae bacterium]|nr:hypothetical protein [Gemmataceae bacterium]